MCPTGQISIRTRDENAILNRDKRRKFESDLGAIQQEIDRVTGGPKAFQQAPPKEVTRDITPERPLPQQPFGAPINSGPSPTQRPGLPRSTGSQVMDQQFRRSRMIGQEPLGQTTSRMSSSSFEALRQELRRIRARELYILNRLRQLNQVRNSQRLLNGRIPFGRNVPMLSQRRRISFGTPNVNQVPRTLRGSVTGQNVERRRMV